MKSYQKHTPAISPILASLLALILAVLVSCRGQFTEEPGLHLNPNMDQQAKVKAQKNAMQVPAGSVAWGRHGVYYSGNDREALLKEDDGYFTGKENGKYTLTVPVKKLLERTGYRSVEAAVYRGQERFDIYCAPCHGRSGLGNGTVSKKGIGLVPNFHDERFGKMEDGRIFETISLGFNNQVMPSYAKQIPEDDRWSIILYLRSLREVPLGTLADLSKAEQESLSKQ